MSTQKIIKTAAVIVLLLSSPLSVFGLNCPTPAPTCATPVQTPAIDARSLAALRLGWVSTPDNRCGGYYSEEPFTYPEDFVKTKLIEITSTGPALFAQHGTSEMQGNVTITQLGQQVTSNRALLYRDPTTSKLVGIDLFGNVHLREPDSLVLANKAHLDLINKTQTLNYILYRTAIYSKPKAKPVEPSNSDLQKERKVTQLSAWGKALSFTKNEPRIFELERASYSTCPPLTNVWRVKASHLVLNKNTGRGVATHARLYIKNIPIFYTPYLNFPIDDRRQTGFLFPVFGTSNWGGTYLGAPFYWNLAPNYDATLTPVLMLKSGLQMNGVFRYLTSENNGIANISVSPYDKAFTSFQSEMESKYTPANSSTVQQADLRRLQDFGPSRGAFSWKNDARYNENWSSHINYNIVSDDYYLRNYRFTVNEITQNQLLQQGELDYNQKHWSFIGRVQQYQTLHPVDDISATLEQYSRFPQLLLTGDYPNQKFGLDYFIANDLSHFDIRKTPGITTPMPIGNRLNIQPGVSLPVNLPYFYITPRVQFALTQYDISHISNNGVKNISRGIPIFDVATGLYFDRPVNLWGHSLQQTLEPQAYYTYIPYRNQLDIPNFDTTLNTLNYNQLFTYNRFSGLDRIGDANQIGIGIASRFLDAETGTETIHLGIGEILYFEDRRVTLCSVDYPNCIDAPTLKNNTLRRSPISGVVSYNLTPKWTVSGNTIWNTQVNKIDNQSISVAYAADSARTITLGYNFVRNGDIVLPNAPPNSSVNNLKQANISFAWPILANWSAVGNVTKSINRNYFQTLVYGLQYDSCCWAMRFVGGRIFTHLDPLKDNNPQYDKQFYVQFALRGLGNFGTGDPSQFISSHTGHVAEFGQDY